MTACKASAVEPSRTLRREWHHGGPASRGVEHSMRFPKPNAAVSPDAILELIRGWKWFAHVPPPAQQWLGEQARVRSVPRDQHVYHSGDPATHIYGVVSGAFRIYLTTPNGDEVTGQEVVHGSWFPHMIPAPKPEYYASCVCQQDAVIVQIGVPVMVEFGERWPGYFRGLYQEMVERGPATLGRILLLSLHNLNVRLAVYLLRMARQRGVAQASGAVFIPGEVSQSEIGARVGATRQRVNTVLKSWSQRGLIELLADGTRILDLPRLTAEARKSGFDVEAYLAGWQGGWQGTQSRLTYSTDRQRRPGHSAKR
jgi:CRP-like cAMP-binding protein